MNTHAHISFNSKRNEGAYLSTKNFNSIRGEQMKTIEMAKLIVAYIEHLKTEDDYILVDCDYLPYKINNAKIENDTLIISGNLDTLNIFDDNFFYSITLDEDSLMDADRYDDYDKSYITKVFNKLKKLDDCSTNFKTFIESNNPKKGITEEELEELGIDLS